MSRQTEILINASSHETRVALLENQLLQELHIERSAERSIVGNIVKGKVTRVVPGMQAAFVDVGLEKNGFLQASDLYRSDIKSLPPLIQDALHEGQSLLVQLIRQPIADKGVRLSTELSISARNLVYLPESDGPSSDAVGVSQKIVNKVERQRLAGLLQVQQEKLGMRGGFIVRTLAEGAREDEITYDALYLQRLWLRIREASAQAVAPALVHTDLPLELRVLRDLAAADLASIHIDVQDNFDQALDFVNDLVPSLKTKLHHYSEPQPIFEQYSIEQSIDDALQQKVQLRSGGSLVLELTEAMNIIDVNTGSFVGKQNQEQTILQTNLEAATEIARQIRLRNLGGIIVIDFIDMQSSANRNKVLNALAVGLALDSVKTTFSEVSSLGLVEITRKRTRESLQQIMCQPCSVCAGSGAVKTAQTVCYEILRQISQEFARYQAGSYTLIAAEGVIDRFENQDASALAKLQKTIQRPIKLRRDNLYHQTQYDIALL